MGQPSVASPGEFMQRCSVCAVFLSACLALAGTSNSNVDTSGPARSEPVPPIAEPRVRFIDSATGYEVNSPIQLTPLASKSSNLVPSEDEVGATPQFHQYEVASSEYYPRSGIIQYEPQKKLQIRVMLDPIEPPDELSGSRLGILRSKTSMIIAGYVVDDDRGFPLDNVEAAYWPAGLSVRTDARGFFVLSIDCRAEQALSRGTLIFKRVGYETVERRHLEIWPGGDWILRIRLKTGEGQSAIDELNLRRGSHHNEVITSNPEPNREGSAPESELAAEAMDSSSLGEGELPTYSGVRLPLRIRVYHNDVVYYESLENYCRHVLPKEWYASWGSYAGGSNSLQAGAVAIRTYGLGYVNQPAANAYDLGSTTAYQVYDPTLTSSRTDAAVLNTAGCVMVGTVLPVARGLTEYSSENNSLGLAMGDGYSGSGISDPVCAGEQRFGHGRGLCQWGSAKWATGLKFPGNSFADTITTHGNAPQNWIWILRHYYPDLRLVRGAVLSTGDEVRVVASALKVRATEEGRIDAGVNSPAIATMNYGAVGAIVAGPELITVDGRGHTWWKIQWEGQVHGWSAENWLERLPPPPANLAAETTGLDWISLKWEYPSGWADGFNLMGTQSLGTPWTLLASTSPDESHCVVSNLNPGASYYFQVQALSLGGTSQPSEMLQVSTLSPWIQLKPATAGTVVISWSAVSGHRYRVQYKRALLEPSWSNLDPDVTAISEVGVLQDVTSDSQRFYRLLRLE